MQTFEELSDIFSDHNNYLTSRELLMRVSPADLTELSAMINLRPWMSNLTCINNNPKY